MPAAVRLGVLPCCDCDTTVRPLPSPSVNRPTAFFLRVCQRDLVTDEAAGPEADLATSLIGRVHRKPTDGVELSDDGLGPTGVDWLSDKSRRVAAVDFIALSETMEVN